jgi:hypothetical protein
MVGNNSQEVHAAAGPLSIVGIADSGERGEANNFQLAYRYLAIKRGNHLL